MKLHRLLPLRSHGVGGRGVWGGAEEREKEGGGNLKGVGGGWKEDKGCLITSLTSSNVESASFLFRIARDSVTPFLTQQVHFYGLRVSVTYVSPVSALG